MELMQKIEKKNRKYTRIYMIRSMWHTFTGIENSCISSCKLFNTQYRKPKITYILKKMISLDRVASCSPHRLLNFSLFVSCFQNTKSDHNLIHYNSSSRHMKCNPCKTPKRQVGQNGRHIHGDHCCTINQVALRMPLSFPKELRLCSLFYG